MKSLVIVPFFILFGLCGFGQSIQRINVVNLQCEYLKNPLGIDAAQPRLTWQILDSRQGAVQKAYKILVGIDSLELVNGTGKFWNSGKVKSDAILVTYSGTKLLPFTRYFWSVECWDMDGKPVKSYISTFETGFMQSASWKGSWISDGIDKNLKPAPFFRKEFQLLKKVKYARAYIAIAGLGVSEWGKIR